MKSDSDRIMLGAFMQLLVQEETTRYMVASGYFGLPVDPETWDGYSYEREKLFEIMSAAQIPSIIFSGDANAAFARELPYGSGISAGIEFTTPAVSEKSIYAVFGDSVGDSLAVDWSAWFNDGLILSNPGVKFADVKDPGFITVKISQESIQSNFYSVSTVMEQDFGVLCQGTFTVLRDDPEKLVVGNCSQLSPDEFVAGTVQILTSEVSETQTSGESDLMGAVMQIVLPLFLNATQNGEEVDVNQVLQTPEMQSIMLDQLMSNFTQITNITLDSEDDQNTAAGFVQMILSSVTEQRLADTDSYGNIDVDTDVDDTDTTIGG
eukprot:TRINITY_DN29005_c0_g1_i4.p1 TRINITY_DN29005_c0_g1~~TRINITY_DN29005_c0_g1_i4.p1  ORF type:complete len:371 (-),score=66.67 TRINITY_DN29005_c0_g1_i4:525-1490(-)